MYLTLLNLCEESLVLSYTKGSALHELVALPSRSSTITFPKSCSATLSLDGDGEKQIDDASVDITLSGTHGASWKPISVPEDCLWRIYLCKVARKHRKLVVIPRRSLPSFLSV
ncbi:hypothetical protein B0H14DRAFT_780335 [Mycena olivaceomarginata]|nr:hypothetical protein B0H14DRAFT_780335 [Mycena olivaceomarginata]